MHNISTGITVAEPLMPPALAQSLASRLVSIPGSFPQIGLQRRLAPAAVPVFAVVAVLAIFTFEAVWDDLLWCSSILIKRDMWTLPITITNPIAQFGELVELQMAASTLAMLPVVIVFLVLQQHIIQGVALSGLKG